LRDEAVPPSEFFMTEGGGHGVGSWLRRRAENVAVAMLAVMFTAFMIQIVFRYVFNFPIGWTSELTIVMWLWGVLWGAAFVVRERDEIRFDLIYAVAGRRARRIFGILAALALVGLYGLSLPASVEYVAFMKVQSTTYLKIRYDHLYSIFAIFAVAIILRYLWLLWRAIRGVAETRSMAAPDAPPGARP
jgi:TRAP-type C4-dicarboxylate transport system permease small subunit